MSKFGKTYAVAVKDGSDIMTIENARSFGISDGILEIEEAIPGGKTRHRFNKDYLVYWAEVEMDQQAQSGGVKLQAVKEDVA